MKKNFLKCAAVSLAMATAVTSPMANVVSVYAAGIKNVTTVNGVASLGRGDASITIQPNAADQTLVRKQFEVFKLFNAENSVNGESINYTFNEEYKAALQNVIGPKLSPAKASVDVTEYEVIDYIQSLNNNVVEGAQASQTLEGRYSDFRFFIEELRNEMKDLGMEGDTIVVTNTRADGSVVIDGLDYGYYIVDEISDNDGDHSASSLCMVNTSNPDAAVTVKSDYPEVIKKIQEDDDRDAIGENGWNDIADYEIGQTVPYKFTSNVPDMNGYDKYYYAWHDMMDEELTFNKDSVAIVISNGSKSYTLTAAEFDVTENKVVDGVTETFVVEIDDLKAIVDREFDNKNALGHNTYGQSVTLTYNATLNDKAALDTGRPGFENDVRLEFSNDPDSTGEGKTGYTPWDTVVCFTYKLNVLKTNDHDAALADAKFRLYSDADCKNEVYVKESANGYIVINRDLVGGTDHTGGTAPSEAVEMVTNADGEIVILGLDGGTYFLKETDAPAGYRVILDPIQLDVTPTFTSERNSYVAGQGATETTLRSLSVSAYVKQFLSGKFESNTTDLETDVEDGSANLTVVNTVGKKLPVTGSNMTIVMLGIGSAMMLVSTKLGKKKEECE